MVSKTGRAEISEDPMGPEQTDVFIMLKPRKQWGTGRDKAELVEAIQKDLAEIPGLRFSFSQPIALRVNELISGVKSDLAVKVFGPDLEVLKTFADRAAAEPAGDRGRAGRQGRAGLRHDPARRGHRPRGGGPPRHQHRATSTPPSRRPSPGKKATTLIEEQRRFAVVVRFPEAARARHPRDRAAARRRPRAASACRSAQLAEFDVVEAPAQVSRENGMRRVVAEANVRGRDLGGFVARGPGAARAAREGAARPATSSSTAASSRTSSAPCASSPSWCPIALLLIMVLLYMALGSIWNSLLVLLNLPFALVGGVIAVVAFRMPLSVSAAVAFIVLLGIAVQNGVVLVAFFRQLREQGESVADTVTKGCDLRFRPLLMTALTSFIGHLPMLYATGSGADIQKPLAVVVMGGLVTSTLLTLLVLPTLYSLFANRFAAADAEAEL